MLAGEGCLLLLYLFLLADYLLGSTEVEVKQDFGLILVDIKRGVENFTFHDIKFFMGY